jgi:hypothetical protein
LCSDVGSSGSWARWQHYVTSADDTRRGMSAIDGARTRDHANPEVRDLVRGIVT